MFVKGEPEAVHFLRGGKPYLLVCFALVPPPCGWVCLGIARQRGYTIQVSGLSRRRKSPDPAYVQWTVRNLSPKSWKLSPDFFFLRFVRISNQNSHAGFRRDQNIPYAKFHHVYCGSEYRSDPWCILVCWGCRTDPVHSLERMAASQASD